METAFNYLDKYEDKVELLKTKYVSFLENLIKYHMKQNKELYFDTDVFGSTVLDI
jgi:hypothetical protein